VSLAGLAARNARLYPDKPAFVMGERTVTFAEHEDRARRLVTGLAARGVGPGARVAILSRNSLEYLDVYAAAETGGLVAAPLNFRLSAGELTGVIERIEPHAVFAHAAYADAIEGVAPGALRVALDGPAPPGWEPLEALLAADAATPAAAGGEDDVCYLMSTSGTSGRPRAAMLTRRGQWLDALALALEMRLEPADRHLAMMPLFHVGGRAIVLAHTLRGCTVHLHDGFDAAAVADDVERHRITTTQVVPTMIAWLLDDRLAGRDLASLRLIWYASAPIPGELLRRALERFGPILIQGYGQTESGPLATTLQPAEHEIGSERLASAGRAVPGVDVRIVDERGAELPVGETGEIAIRSPFTMTGYWRGPELTADTLVDGWLRTGDMGRMDERGYVYVVDRKKDMIITGGENVYPREVEEALHGHPAVQEAAVIGVPDDVWGEAVHAIVVPAAETSAEELIAFCRERLAHYKCPRTVELREALPRTPSGKVLKRALRSELVGGRA
jgi:acyl-CoA synthetase (AMP-forming)/AMP-acid ligase II